MRAKCGARPGAGPSGRFLAGTGTGAAEAEARAGPGNPRPVESDGPLSFSFSVPGPARRRVHAHSESSAAAATPFKLAAGPQPVGGARARGGPVVLPGWPGRSNMTF
jgi:hypothetical protein